MTSIQLDARRLLCPLPVIRLQDKLKTLELGDRVEIVCTDRGVLQDIPAWCRVHGHKVVNMIQRTNEIIITIEKAK